MLRTLALLITSVPVLLAHEGHHQVQNVLWHVLSAPDHLALLTASLGLALGIAGLLLRRRRLQTARDAA